MDALHHLVYASTAAADLTPADLLKILEVSRRFNAEHQLTGILLYAPGASGAAGTFVQVLEGPRAEVDALYARIQTDRRHRECTIIRQGVLFARRFPDWTMGFRHLDEVRPEELVGFNPIFQNPWSLESVLRLRDPVLQLVYSFAGA